MAQRITINIEEYRDQIGTAYHHKYRRIQGADRRSAQRTTISTEEYRNQIGTTFHIQYRSIQTKVNNAVHTTTQNSFRAQEGGGAGGGPSGQCHLVRDALFPKVTVYGKKRLYTVTFFIMQRRCAHEFSVYL